MKRTFLYIALAICLFLVVEVVLWTKDQATVTNRAYRIISGAPAVHYKGKLLMYSGRVNYDDSYYTPYGESDEKVTLYKASGVPDGTNPPWFFVKNRGRFYRYKLITKGF